VTTTYCGEIDSMKNISENTLFYGDNLEKKSMKKKLDIRRFQ